MKPKKTRLKIKCVKLVTQKKLEKHPYCMFCGKPAVTAHHYIPQSRSNYLKCDSRNLIPICKECHHRIHSSDANKFGLILQKMMGDEWRDGLIKDSNKRIKDTMKYWTDKLAELEK